MEANELRIGNWLIGEYNGFSKAVQVYEFSRTHIIHTDENGIPLELKYFRPKPITEEILLNNGFLKIGMYYFRIKGGISGKEIEIGLSEEGVFRVESLHMKPQVIEYVHQLQNKVFFCENEELIFNL